MFSGFYYFLLVQFIQSILLCGFNAHSIHRFHLGCLNTHKSWISDRMFCVSQSELKVYLKCNLSQSAFHNAQKKDHYCALFILLHPTQLLSHQLMFCSISQILLRFWLMRFPFLSHLMSSAISIILQLSFQFLFFFSFFPSFLRFIYLKGSVTFAGSVPIGPRCVSWSCVQPGSRSHLCMSHVGAGVQTLGIFCTSPGALGGSLMGSGLTSTHAAPPDFFFFHLKDKGTVTT